MVGTPYTLAVWRVIPGQEAAFIEAWKGLSAIFRQLPHPPTDIGTLVQSLSDPTLFYSFGAWRSFDDIQAMRTDAQAQEGIRKLREMCTEAMPGGYKVVAEA